LTLLAILTVLLLSEFSSSRKVTQTQIASSSMILPRISELRKTASSRLVELNTSLRTMMLSGVAADNVSRRRCRSSCSFPRKL